MNAKYQGQCLCGAVTFEADRVVEDSLGACHCKMCQRWAGSALLAISVPPGAVCWHGESHIKKAQTSDWAERAWCNNCGSGLWYRPILSEDADYEIPLGLFENLAGIDMRREIFIDRKMENFDYAGEREKLTEAEVLALYGVTTEGT